MKPFTVYSETFKGSPGLFGYTLMSKGWMVTCVRGPRPTIYWLSPNIYDDHFRTLTEARNWLRDYLIKQEAT